MALNVKNRTIFEGDNLEILRGVNSDSVDLIYLDPPFNSNRTYSAPIGSEAAGASFKDAWTLDDIDEAWHGEIGEREPGLYRVIDSAELSHGKGMKSYLIFMAVRLVEMKRVLKPEGSIYLHCDLTAVHYLKLVMDTIFGKNSFKNEIVWQRNSSHNDSKKFGQVTDRILFWGTQNINGDAVRVPLNEEHVKKSYRYRDKDGQYTADNLSAKGLSGGGYEYNFHGHIGPWRYPEKRMLELEEEGRIHIPKKINGVPRLKRYLKENKGQVPTNVWTDIPVIGSRSKERTGYPTQKPLALLERIIKASTNEGDIVLDPFCGCATTCVASEKLNRQWVGIDLSSLAVKLVKERLSREVFVGEGSGFKFFGDVIHRTDIPIRTNIEKLPSYKTHKHTLFGLQEGKCNGCDMMFPFQNFTTDHIVPVAKGGTDHIENLQLLCNSCNSIKGKRTQEELIVALQEKGFV